MLRHTLRYVWILVCCVGMLLSSTVSAHAAVGESYKGWGRVAATSTGTAETFRWDTASGGWVRSSIKSGYSVYIQPYSTGWMWAYCAPRPKDDCTGLRVGWHAVKTAQVDALPSTINSQTGWNQLVTSRTLPPVTVIGLNTSGRAASVVANRLDNIPKWFVDALVSQRATSVLYSGRLVDVPGYTQLRDVPVSYGWGSQTWNSVPGVGLGPNSTLGFAANPDKEADATSHSSSSLSLHELGHAADLAMGRSLGLGMPLSDAPNWRTQAMPEAVAAYGATSHMGANRNEWFAEAFALYSMYPETNAFLRARYPKTYAILASFGAPRF